MKFSACKKEIHIMDNNTSINISDVHMDASTDGLVDCM